MSVSQIFFPGDSKVLTFLAANSSQGQGWQSATAGCNNVKYFDLHEWEVPYSSNKPENIRDSNQEEGREDPEDEDEDTQLAEDAGLMEDEYHMEPTRPPAETGFDPEPGKDLPQYHSAWRL